MMSEYNLQQEISGPTRVTQGSQSLINLIFTSNSDMFAKVGKTELGLSDHCMVYGIIRAQKYLEKHLEKSVRCWKKCCWKKCTGVSGFLVRITIEILHQITCHVMSGVS